MKNMTQRETVIGAFTLFGLAMGTAGIMILQYPPNGQHYWSLIAISAGLLLVSLFMLVKFKPFKNAGGLLGIMRDVKSKPLPGLRLPWLLMGAAMILMGVIFALSVELQDLVVPGSTLPRPVLRFFAGFPFAFVGIMMIRATVRIPPE